LGQVYLPGVEEGDRAGDADASPVFLRAIAVLSFAGYLVSVVRSACEPPGELDQELQFIERCLVSIAQREQAKGQHSLSISYDTSAAATVRSGIG